MKIRPLQDRVIVQRIDEEEKTKGGIIIPDTAKEKPQEGKVIAVGPGKILENGTKTKLDVKVGDKILFGKYSGTAFHELLHLGYTRFYGIVNRLQMLNYVDADFSGKGQRGRTRIIKTKYETEDIINCLERS